MESDPAELRFDVPHPARVWNYWLGGKDNYDADRAVGDRVAQQNPEILDIARQARQFLIRSVTFLARDVGVDQFLDIGTGLPTAQNTHQVAQLHNPAAKIAYVDNDPLVLAHARTLLANTTAEGVTTYIHADVREPENILAEAARTLDFERPIAVMLLGILGHAAPRFEDSHAIIQTLMACVPSGSYLSIVDGSDTSEKVRESASMNNYTLRSLDEFRRYFDGLELLEPGVVPTPLWRPDPADVGTARPIDSCGAVGRKP